MKTLRAAHIKRSQVSIRHRRSTPVPSISLARFRLSCSSPTLDSSLSTRLLVPQHQRLSSCLLRDHSLRDHSLRARSTSTLCSPLRLSLVNPRLLGAANNQNPTKQSRSYHAPPSQRTCYKEPDASTRPIKSSFSSWTFIAVVIVGLFYSVSDIGRFNQETQKSKTTLKILDDIEYEISKMTGEALPGRPGTLTPEQEEKLRELWLETFLLFGVLDAKDVNGNEDADPSAGRVRSNTANSKKPKKKRLSLFRKHKDGEDEEIDSPTSPTHADDDKYGQTKEFHDAIATLTPETLRTTFWAMVKHDNPDALLLRFLRARKWDVKKALVMMISTMKWRSTVNIDDDIMARGELGALEDSLSTDKDTRRHGHDFLTQMRMGKSFLHGIDKTGRPMCFVRVRLHRQGEQSEQSLERYTIFVIESARLILNPPVDTACIVFDMTNFSMANMDYTPVKFMIKCFEANYPESLGVVLVHKAPWIFQGIWKVIKGWLDPVVASKIQFTSDEAAMEEFVPKDQIITELGGHEDWTYKYFEPVPGENDTMKDTATRDRLQQERSVLVKECEKATVNWIHGTGDMPQVKLKRMEVFRKLKESYWQLDPYIRAKSYYDRCGMINPGGEVHFYPQKERAVATNGASKPIETSQDDVD